MNNQTIKYGKELSIDQIRKIQLRILVDVTDFCEKHDIKYFLCAGTMLGAIRHKGFIPWDDDIDIMIPRPDYETLKNIFSIEGLQFFDSEIEPKYDKTFGKIADVNTILIENIRTDFHIGINIDVFPIDGFPSNAKEIQRHIRRIQMWRNFLNLKNIKLKKGRSWYKNSILLIGRIILFPIPKSFVIEKIISLGKKYKLSESEFAGIAVWGYGTKEVFHKSIFDKRIKVEFELNKYYAHEKYDEYLRGIYGSYMELPPLNERRSKHDFNAYVNNELS